MKGSIFQRMMRSLKFISFSMALKEELIMGMLIALLGVLPMLILVAKSIFTQANTV